MAIMFRECFKYFHTELQYKLTTYILILQIYTSIISTLSPNTSLKYSDSI
jgi:hypothetical protein